MKCSKQILIELKTIHLEPHQNVTNMSDNTNGYILNGQAPNREPVHCTVYKSD